MLSTHEGFWSDSVALEKRYRAANQASMRVKNFLIDVRPELLEREVGRVNDVASQPFLSDLGPGTVFGWVVERGDAGCRARTRDLGIVEGAFAIVFAGEQDTSGGIERPLAEAAVTKRIEAIVLTEDDRPDTADHKVLVSRVGQRMPVVTAVADYALVKFRIGLVIHRKACLKGCKEEGRIVEAVMAGGDELLSGGLRPKIDIRRDRAEVRHDAKNAFRLLRAIGADGIGVVDRLCGWICRLRRRLRLKQRTRSVGKRGIECQGGADNRLLSCDWSGKGHSHGRQDDDPGS